LINAWLDGRCFNNISVVAVIMESNGYLFKRAFTCRKVTSNKAELKAMELVLLSVVEGWYDDLLVNSSGPYCVMMMEVNNDGDWKRKAIVNVDLVQRIRNLSKNFKSVKVMRNLEDPTLIALKTISNKLAKNPEIIYEKNWI